MNWDKINRYLTGVAILLCLIVIAMGMVGCASTPMTQARYEQMERSCRNVGGVWYHYGALDGECDYEPMWRGL
jgi:hypothetical protein